jgi:hypothetical protein
MKKKTMICFRCRMEIFHEDHYFKFVEYHNNENIRSDYAHKDCWDEFKGTLKVTSQAMGMLQGLKKTMVKEGILEEEEKVVEIF